MAEAFELSVIIPVYNEKKTISEIVSRVAAVPVSKEIVLVDDGSTDGTRDVMRSAYEGQKNIALILREKNGGKGSAIRAGISAASGKALIIQDADLEYNPMDYLPLLDALKQSGASVVFGSRFLDKKKVTSGWHRAVNFFLTWLTNLLYGSNLTDMETCYKLFRTDLIKNLGLVSDGFEIEPEITAKLLKRGERIVEVPISYKGRSFHEGKKIGWKDGIRAVITIFKYRLT